MPSTFLKGSQIAAQALGLLERELMLPMLITRYGKADFAGQANDTITIRIPAVTVARDYEWRTRTAPIVLDDLTERSITVKLDKHPYSAVPVTDEQLTLDITNFGEQVTAPQVRAVAEKLEGYAVTAMTSAAYGTAQIVTAVSNGDGAAFGVLVDARKILNKNNVPMTGRAVVVGADVDALFLKDKQLNRVDQSGSDGALRDASLGRLAGFDVYVSNSIPAGDAYAFHKSAFSLATVAPDVPAGAAAGAGFEKFGLAMRWIRDYDVNFARDRSFVSAFAGASSTLDGEVAAATVNNKALTSNVATLTTAAAHGFTTGQTVTVAIGDVVFDGTFTITGTPSATTFTYARTNANVTSAAASGTATVAGKMVRAVKINFT